MATGGMTMMITTMTTRAMTDTTPETESGIATGTETGRGTGTRISGRGGIRGPSGPSTRWVKLVRCFVYGSGLELPWYVYSRLSTICFQCFILQQEEDEDYSYSDSWKDDDYFRDFKDSWDRQAKELPEPVADPDMMSSWSETMAQRVKLINWAPVSAGNRNKFWYTRQNDNTLVTGQSWRDLTVTMKNLRIM